MIRISLASSVTHACPIPLHCFNRRRFYCSVVVSLFAVAPIVCVCVGGGGGGGVGVTGA